MRIFCAGGTLGFDAVLVPNGVLMKFGRVPVGSGLHLPAPLRRHFRRAVSSSESHETIVTCGLNPALPVDLLIQLLGRGLRSAGRIPCHEVRLMSSSGPPAGGGHSHEQPGAGQSAGSGSAPPSVRKSDHQLLSRRELIVAGAGLAIAGMGSFAAVRSCQVSERAERRESERQAWELPPTSGPPLRYRVVREEPLDQALLALPGENQLPERLRAEQASRERLQWFFDNGAAWVSGISFRLQIESLRRSLVLGSAFIRILKRTAPLDGTLIGLVGIGGPEGVISEIPKTGANLDHERPGLRMLNPEWKHSRRTEEGLPPLLLEELFPAQQITLDSHAVQAVDIRAESRQFACEWELVLEVTADGEPMEVVVRRSGKPFRATAAAPAYQSALREEGTSESFRLGRTWLVAADARALLGVGVS